MSYAYKCERCGAFRESGIQRLPDAKISNVFVDVCPECWNEYVVFLESVRTWQNRSKTEQV